ncbi:hypothetical protein AAFF_G00440690 [Aldrovandia affinis]|uniref:Uncharacterized protein n=1 Tax=Aldrovandia affinis TaxID=143900 RepID=A0AAD7S772_9TELE|nr:hypothetical protein AAFF_G00440690 [Aldrovandia affinis]
MAPPCTLLLPHGASVLHFLFYFIFYICFRFFPNLVANCTLYLFRLTLPTRVRRLTTRGKPILRGQRPPLFLRNRTCPAHPRSGDSLSVLLGGPEPALPPPGADSQMPPPLELTTRAGLVSVLTYRTLHPCSFVLPDD